MRTRTISMSAAMLLAASSYSQTVVSSSASVDLLPTAPSSVMPDDLTSPSLIRAFHEKQNVTLPTNVHLDVSAPGTYDGGGTGAPGHINAGTVVSCFFLHTNDPSPSPSVSGFVTFQEDIIGFAFFDQTLGLSDFLGSPTTLYPGSVSHRGYEPGDLATISADLHTISINVNFAEPGDQLRVFTTATTVPEPCTLVVLGLGAIACCRRRRSLA